MTIVELLNKATDHLKSSGITNARTSSEILLAHTLGIKRLDLYLRFDLQLKESEITKFKDLYKRRLKFEPIQYILGETEFFALPFKVDYY